MNSEYPDSTPSRQHLSAARIIVALLALLLIFVTYEFYWESLFNSSHDLILDLQAGRSPENRDAWITFGWYSGGHYFALAGLLLSPFLSRERFWYYVIML